MARRFLEPVRATAIVVATAVVFTAPAAAAPRSANVPPPTPVPPDGSPSPYPTVLDTPIPSEAPPHIEATSAALADLDSGRILWERGAEVPLPIASLTKVMTALLVIERTLPTEIVTVSDEAASQSGAELGLVPGEQVMIRDLLHALLLQSANDAAVALAEHVSGSVETFVDLMNRRAVELRMRDTEYRSPSGLDDAGHSTARDLLRLASAAFLDPTFASITATKFATVPAENGEPRRLQNRNALLWLYDDVFGGKTGYTSAAGFCLIAAAERDGLRLATVVLGAPEQAFDAGAEVLNHGFAAWRREEVVTLGERTDVSVEGETVPTEADTTLSVLVRRDAEVETEVILEPPATLPIVEGAPVASLVATANGRTLGQTRLIAAEDVRSDPPPEAAGPLWLELWRSVTTLFGRVFEVLAG